MGVDVCTVRSREEDLFDCDESVWLELAVRRVTRVDVAEG
jgi:hypothetical protein